MTESTHPIRVVVAEDDPAIRSLLRAFFADTEFRVTEAENGQQAVQTIAEKRPDIVLLDLGLPDISGEQVIATVREWSQVPIIVVSAQGREEQKVRCLDAGADDYVTKPFGLSELMARMRVALRHANRRTTDEPVFESGDLKIDFAARRVFVRDEEIHLTPLEYKLLQTLVRHEGKVVTARQLLKEVWGAEYTDETQYLRVYMGYLRKKIERDPENPTMILTEHRVGYRLVV